MSGPSRFCGLIHHSCYMILECRLKPKSVKVVCHSLRRAIWSWISHHPSEFIGLYRSKTKMSGAELPSLFSIFVNITLHACLIFPWTLSKNTYTYPSSQVVRMRFLSSWKSFADKSTPLGPVVSSRFPSRPCCWSFVQTLCKKLCWPCAILALAQGEMSFLWVTHPLFFCCIPCIEISWWNADCFCL